LLYRHTGTTEDAKLRAITDTRTALLAGLIGVGALLTFWLNSRVYRITARTLEVTEQGHITDRYTKAIEQLGSDKLDVRLGGIYALERIAVDSKRDHPTVVEVLCALVREGSRRHGAPRPKQSMVDEAAEKPDATAPGTDAKPRPATDVQAALSVLGRLPQQPNVSRGDLTGAQVAGAHLGGANLTSAQLAGADLSGARLYMADLTSALLGGADLSGATLAGANLTGAQLVETNLSGASLAGANLSGASLAGANLTGAQLGGANLTNAWLVGADLSVASLRGQNLSGAHLGGAILSGATLHGADLRQARELVQPQLEVARGDARTQLPAGLERPASWRHRRPPQAHL
jgi:hypothetical protein